MLMTLKGFSKNIKQREGKKEEINQAGKEVNVAMEVLSGDIEGEKSSDGGGWNWKSRASRQPHPEG